MIHSSRPSLPQKSIVHKPIPDSPQEDKARVSRFFLNCELIKIIILFFFGSRLFTCSTFLSLYGFIYSREAEDRKYESSGKKITHLSTSDELKDSVQKTHYKEEYSCDNVVLRKNDQKKKRFSVVALVYFVILFDYLHT